MPVARPSLPYLVGESNPYGGDPYFALYPSPEGCAGHRMCRLVLGMRRADYLRAFERVNLCAGPWRVSEAKHRASEILNSERGRTGVVLCGAKVSRAFGVEFSPFDVFQAVGETYSTSVLVLPHPSGLCRLWNDPRSVPRARRVVSEFMPWLAPLLGVED